MQRIKFEKTKQKEFIKKVLEKLGCPSLRSLRQHGIEIKYSCLKNYYSEYRTLPENLFEDLCDLAKIKKEDLAFKTLQENYGQVIGGRK